MGEARLLVRQIVEFPHHDKPKPALASRRDAPVVCARCGRSVPRQARQQRFCSDRCRERNREGERGKQRSRKALLRGDTGAPRAPPKKANGFNVLSAPKSRSSIALQAPRHVIEAEIFGGRVWRSVVSSSGVVCEVGALRERALRDGRVS